MGIPRDYSLALGTGKLRMTQCLPLKREVPLQSWWMMGLGGTIEVNGQADRMAKLAT
jgi:hypothetical protein